MLKPNHVLDFSQFVSSPRGREIEDTETQPFLDFQPILSILTVGEGIEDTEPQPCLGFPANLSPLPAGEG